MRPPDTLGSRFIAHGRVVSELACHLTIRLNSQSTRPVGASRVQDARRDRTKPTQLPVMPGEQAEKTPHRLSSSAMTSCTVHGLSRSPQPSPDYESDSGDRREEVGRR